MIDFFKKLTIIIPMAEGDACWKDLLQDLFSLSSESEILLVGSESPDINILDKAKEKLLAKVKFVKSSNLRGAKYNAGVSVAHGDVLWFLQSDTKVPRATIYALKKHLSYHLEALNYFDLHFLSDGPKWVGINSAAANLTTRYLGLPSWDQSFSISRLQFDRVGGFQESDERNVESAFIWAARRKKIPLYRVPGAVYSSAKRYEDSGWVKTTCSDVSKQSLINVEGYLKLLKQRALDSI